MRYHIITYGCQMNRSNSERIAAVLENCGYSPTPDKNKADLIVINVCSVRQSAIDRIYGLISNIKNKKDHGVGVPTKVGTVKTQIKNQKIILTGCILAKDKEKLKDNVNFILDIKDLQRWPEIISKFNPPAGGQNSKLQLIKTKNYLKIQPRYSTFPIAYLPIMTGCDNFCAYCVVPYTRGREISRPVKEIICEVKELIKKGYKAIILLGQNVNSYHSRISTNPSRISRIKDNNLSDISGKFVQIRDCNFPKLLKMVNDLTGDFWLTFITSHPKDLSDELIKTMAKCEKLMPYLHLPVQSGDDEILKKMNRHYTVSHYKKLICDIRAKFAKISDLPISVSTDIIVGFPGETKKQFANTAKLMREIKFDMAYIAMYSPRPGTTAAKLKDNVLPEEKEKRWKTLANILKKTALEKNKKYLGKTIKVLIENKKDDFLLGQTKTFKNVKIKWSTNNKQRVSIGDIIKVKIKKIMAFGLEVW